MVKLDNLFIILSQKGISQSRLAEDTSISTGNISDWKRGRSMPSAVKLDELATYLDCSVDYLLGRTDDPKKNIATGDITNSNIDHSMNIMASPAPDSTTKQFLDTFEELSLADKIKVISYAIELKNKE